MIPLLEAIAEGWSWKIGKPEAVVATNRFGNVIVKNTEGHYFRIMPEERHCELLAVSTAELEGKRNNAKFIHDWEMKELIVRAETSQGRLAEGQVYRMIKKKFRKTDLRNLLSNSGNMAHEIEGLTTPMPSPKFLFGLVKKHKRTALLSYMLPVTGALISSVIYRPDWIDLIMLVIAALLLCWLITDFDLGITRSNWGTYARSLQPARFWLSVSIWIGMYILISIFPILFALQERAKSH